MNVEARHVPRDRDAVSIRLAHAQYRGEAKRGRSEAQPARILVATRQESRPPPAVTRQESTVVARLGALPRLPDNEAT